MHRDPIKTVYCKETEGEVKEGERKKQLKEEKLVALATLCAPEVLKKGEWCPTKRIGLGQRTGNLTITPKKNRYSRYWTQKHSIGCTVDLMEGKLGRKSPSASMEGRNYLEIMGDCPLYQRRWNSVQRGLREMGWGIHNRIDGS